MKATLKRKLHLASNSQSGATTIEFAMLFAAFVAILLVSLYVSVLFMAKSQLDYVAQQVARQVMTGQVTTQSQLRTAVCSATSAFFVCGNIMSNLTSYTSGQLDSINTSSPVLTYNSNGTVSNSWNAQFGAANSIMVLQLVYQYPVIGGSLFSFATQPNGTYLMVSNAVFTNE